MFKLSTIKLYGREAAAAAGVIIAVTNAVHLPASVRSTLLAGSALLLSIHHGISKLTHDAHKSALVNQPAAPTTPKA
jgi:hypothetical protein